MNPTRMRPGMIWASLRWLMNRVVDAIWAVRTAARPAETADRAEGADYDGAGEDVSPGPLPARGPLRATSGAGRSAAIDVSRRNRMSLWRPRS
jgi:hypothetical protein